MCVNVLLYLYFSSQFVCICLHNFFFNPIFLAMFCVVYTCVNMCATSLDLVNELVTCCYSI